ncbi:hypothetical protein Tco_0829495 [Tanacetum coccineum]
MSASNLFLSLNKPDKTVGIVEVPKPSEWAPDEWYYQIEFELLMDWKAEDEQLAREQCARDRVAKKEHLLQQAREHEEELAASRPYYNLFEDDSYQIDDIDEDYFEGLDCDEIHLVFDREKSPKFHC